MKDIYRIEIKLKVVLASQDILEVMFVSHSPSHRTIRDFADVTHSHTQLKPWR